MAKKQFKTESKRLLDLMVNSIYTNREIFLRELISNASDALDKRHYLSITDDTQRISKDDLTIELSIDKENRRLIITDTGIGMTSEELENNLGTIAHSGSLEFKKKLEEGKDVEIIGQFGVGFYSAFMIAKMITVNSKSCKEDQAYKWESTGDDGYTISLSDKFTAGTEIILTLKDNTDTENYDEYLETYTLKQLIKKYSDYVRYPIGMMVETTHKKEDSDEYETVMEHQIINSMIPLWKRNKKDVSEEEYNDFYRSKFFAFDEPAKTLHYSLEGNISYNALLYIPTKAPYNFYSSEYEPGLQLYCKGVFIMDKAKDLLPSYFRFVKGLVDSNDLNLNISREILQQDRQMKTMAKSIEKKIRGGLEDLLKNNREKYEEFFQSFGLQLKYGVYEDFGAHKETLQNLILFKSSFEDKYVTLKEYTERMKENQDLIYYACGQSIEQINLLPQMERLKDKGYEVLYFLDDVDEFATLSLQEFEGKKFKSIAQGDLNLDTEEEKQEIEKKKEENKDLLSMMKETLHETVSDVRISSRLKSHPVCLVSDEGVSLEMEKILSQNPEGSSIKASRILEINPNHPIFTTLQKLKDTDESTLKMYTNILYNQALLIEGLNIDNPVEYANQICDLMSKMN
ncbi:MAG: molecular chaperone HtpG [Erysipelotrichaceae bacterium]|nr:molecular chaperone HtpG [Erysipelotrichaceae bacterium]